MLLDGVAVQRLLPQTLVSQEPGEWLSRLRNATLDISAELEYRSRAKVTYQPTVAMASPMAKKSTNTADRMVNVECHKLLLNLWAQDTVVATPCHRQGKRSWAWRVRTPRSRSSPQLPPASSR